eukprot:2644424-Pyramimonas_sp.AAC.1
MSRRSESTGELVERRKRRSDGTKALGSRYGNFKTGGNTQTWGLPRVSHFGGHIGNQSSESNKQNYCRGSCPTFRSRVDRLVQRTPRGVFLVRLSKPCLRDEYLELLRDGAQADERDTLMCRAFHKRK